MPLLEACLEGETSTEAYSSDCTWSGVRMWSPDLIIEVSTRMQWEQNRPEAGRAGFFRHTPLINL
jgi:hypothetical protein